MTLFVPDNELYARLRGVLERDWIPIPEETGYGGSGAPGRLLEDLLEISGRNYSMPDAGKWEIKFHTGKTLLTLFHMEAEPPGYMHDLIKKFGWEGKHGQTNFRHTLRGRSKRGFYVVNEGERIYVKNDVGDIDWPYWTHDRLINAFAAKFRQLITVTGAKQQKAVRYDSARLYKEPQITRFIDAIERGVVAIDFDARTTNGSGLRNHGTKFRVNSADLHTLYHHHEEFDRTR